MKICNGCEKEKNFSDFPVRKYEKGKKGVESRCFGCKRKTHREHIREKRSIPINRVVERENDFIRRSKFPEKEMWNRARKRAQRDGAEFTISIEDIKINKTCPLLGIPLIVQKGIASDNSPSLDRINTLKGYIPGNIAVISRLANIMKAHASKQLLLKFSKNISKYIKLSPE